MAGFGRSMNRLYENRNHDLFSNGEFALLRQLSEFSPKVIIDGGANKGLYCLTASKCCPDASIYAMEPVRNTFLKLKSAVEEVPSIKPVQTGLFREKMSRDIHLFKSDTHSSLFDIQGIHYGPVDTEQISLCKGDDFLQQEGIEQVDLLKLDLEGAEYDALLGFEQSLKNRRIDVIQFEYGYINITTKHLLLDFYQLLEGYGYQVGKLFPKSVEFRPYAFKYEDFIGPNFVAVSGGRPDLQAAFGRLTRN